MKKDIKENEIDNSRRENANINTNTPMGLMLKYGTDTAKKYNLENLVNEKARKYHEEGIIHIHDLDFYSSTSTCCQIDLSKLFKDGFSTGHGSLREPNSIATAFALSAIAIQSNQSDQHGGQSIPAIDHYLSPYVLKSYVKHLVNGIETVTDIEEEELLKIKDQIIKEVRSIFSDDEVIRIVSKILPEPAIVKLIKQARKMLNKEVYQGAEGFIHNLNTLNSRSGSQVPFSSINYGTDTSHEGRIIIRSLLLATEAGLGNGETPIFPIQIFKLKEGVNYNKEDPNYDLFQLSMRVSSKRLFPNYSFLDSSFNAPYLKDNRPETEVAYMGCAQRDEVVIYRENGIIKTSGIGRLYDKLATKKKIKNFGISKFINTEGELEVYDSSQKGFVGVKKVIKNPNLFNWYKVSFYDGHSLKLTADHPLYIKNRGRVEVKDIKKGDEVYSSNAKIEQGLFKQDSDLAWWKGVLTNAYKIGRKYQVDFDVDKEENIEAFIEISKSFSYKVKNFKKDGKSSVRFIGKGNKILDRFIRAFYLEKTKDKRLPIPNEIFTYDRKAKSSFIAGLLSTSGKVEESSKEYLMNYFVDENKERALQLQELLNTLNIKNNLYTYISAGIKGREEVSRVEFQLFDDFVKESRNIKFTSGLDSFKIMGMTRFFQKTETKAISRIERIELFEDSYDLETESDRFDLSGVISHNCRTRVMSNVYDETAEDVAGRGNLSFTSVNLPGLAFRAEKDLNKFFTLLEDAMEVITKQLLSRMEQLGIKTDKNFLFLIGQEVWRDSDKLKDGEEISEVIKHGTLTYGFVGLAEALVLLIGKHHGESREAQELGSKIVKYMRDFADRKAQEYKLNFSLIATPAESLAGRFNKIDREKFGSVERVTDKIYYTNSFHIPVNYKISITKKIELEGPYHKLTNGGHITYVELDGDPSQNLKAFEKVIRKMKDSDIGYGSINHPIDTCPHCKYTGVIYNECPGCGFVDGQDGIAISRIRRITGYIVGTLDRWNDAKRAELKDRVKHNGN